MTSWKRPFEPTHRKPKDRLKLAQIAPLCPIQPVQCGRLGCADPRLIHREDGKCLRVGCGCTEYVEVNG